MRLRRDRVIEMKTPEQFSRMREAGLVVANTLRVLAEAVRPGITTADLDAIAEREIREAGAVPSFLGYYGYPATICTSVNEEIVHGIPSEKRMLKAGDIVSVDCGVVIDGYYGDAAVTVPVGDEVTAELSKLLKVTEESLYRGIEKARIGNSVSDIGGAVQEHVEAAGFSVVREFVGHGIGTRLHEEPQIPNYRSGGPNPRLREGMVLAIEPMVNYGKPETRVLSDKWTAVTADGSYSAHFEHCVAVTKDGPVILTQ